MTKKHRREDLRSLADRLPASCRSDALRAIQICEKPGHLQKSVAKQTTEQLVRAVARTERKREIDWASEHRTRVLVGIRAPAELAALCRFAANENGVSLYRWVFDALVGALPPVLRSAFLAGR